MLRLWPFRVTAKSKARLPSPVDVNCCRALYRARASDELLVCWRLS